MYFRLGELFCGPGGIAKGALSASISNSNWKIIHAWANDYDQSNDFIVINKTIIQKIFKHLYTRRTWEKDFADLQDAGPFSILKAS